MYILWFYLLVRCFSIEERFSKQLLLLGIIFMLLFEAVFFDWFNFRRYERKYSSFQQMELVLGEMLLLPTETWDIYPQGSLLSSRYEIYYDRLPPFPLINYKIIGTCILIKKTYGGVTKIVIMPSDAPHEELYDPDIYDPDIGNMFAYSDRKGNQYYSGGLGYKNRVTFEYQDYLYVIDVEWQSGSIADEIYYDMRYGMQ